MQRKSRVVKVSSCGNLPIRRHRLPTSYEQIRCSFFPKYMMSGINRPGEFCGYTTHFLLDMRRTENYLCRLSTPAAIQSAAIQGQSLQAQFAHVRAKRSRSKTFHCDYCINHNCHKHQLHHDDVYAGFLWGTLWQRVMHVTVDQLI